MKHIYLVVALCFLGISASAQFWTEDFETDGSGVRYTVGDVGDEFRESSNDHYGRTDGSNTSGNYTAMSGAFYWAGEDINDTPIGNGVNPKTLTFAAQDITGMSSVNISGLFAQGSSGGGLDVADFLRIEYQVDGGGWTTAFQFHGINNGDTSNNGAAFDTNNDGTGDGTPLTSTFASFDADVSVSGTSMEVRIVMSADSGSEELAYDLIALTDNSVLPSTDTEVNYSSPTYTLAEDGLFVDVCVDIVNPSAAAATVVTLDLNGASTAINGTDYDDGATPAAAISFPATLTFPAGSSAAECITIFISNDDLLIEDDETIVLDITAVSGGTNAFIGAEDQTTVTINDNDFPDFCDAPAWQSISPVSSPSASDGNSGEWTPEGFDGLTVNGFCGGDCSDPVESWLISGPYDMSGSTFAKLSFDAVEGFFGTDLGVFYSTDYATDPCPSNATWVSLATISTTDFYELTVSAATGNTDVFFGIQYIDSDGQYSDWTVSSFFLEADVCPTVGTAPASACLVCEGSLTAGTATCDALTAGLDTYTATFTYDATLEVNDLTVAVTSGTADITTITAGNTGTITVTGLSEGTDVTMTITNALCDISATVTSPSCIVPPTPTCGVGETSLAFDSFEGGTAATTLTPASYDQNGDVWASSISEGALSAFDGAEFWAMRDLANGPNGGVSAGEDSRLEYALTLTAGQFTSIKIAFQYFAVGYDGTDGLFYEYQIDGGGFTRIEIEKDNPDWTLEEADIAIPPSATSFDFALVAIQDGGSDYAGFDDLNICGSTEVFCSASLSAGAATCESITDGMVDTYSAVFSVVLGFETSVSVSASAGTPDMTTLTADGDVTVTGIPEGTDVMLTITNGNCDISETITAPACEPIPTVIITEFMPDPELGNANDGEYFEIYNPGGTAIDINGWVISDDGADSHTISGAPMVPAMSYYIMARGGDMATNGGVTADYVYNSFILANSADEIVISAGGLEIDRVNYTGTWPTGDGIAAEYNEFTAGDNSDVANWCEATTAFGDGDFGSPGAMNMSCEAPSPEDCDGAIALSTGIFGTPSWTTYPLGASESLPGIEGDADDDTWFSFDATGETIFILAQDPAFGYEVAVEVYDACDGTSLGSFNNYGPGAIERVKLTGLTVGETYVFRLYDIATGASASTDVRVAVKSFIDSGVNDSFCDRTDLVLSEAIYAERDDLGQMYANALVPVVKYQFRFVDPITETTTIANHPTFAPYLTLGAVPGLAYGVTYEVSVRHTVNIRANGDAPAEEWSPFGTPCSIALATTAPTTALAPSFCDSGDDRFLGDVVQATPLAGATAYRFTFVGGGETFVKTTSSYGVLLYTVGTSANGLKYNGTIYDVTVEAQVAGVWSAPGASCQIAMATQPEATRVREADCDMSYIDGNSNGIIANQVVGASMYQFRLTSLFSEEQFIENRPGVSLTFHTAANDYPDGPYLVDVRATVGDAQGDFGTSCNIMIGEGIVIETSIGGSDSEPKPVSEGLSAKSISAVSNDAAMHIYPNPAEGAEFNVQITGLVDQKQAITLQVFDMIGQEVHQERFATQGADATVRVNLTNALQAGIYVVRLTSGTQIIDSQLIVR